MGEQHVIDTGTVQVGLDEVGALLPAIGELMDGVARAMHVCYHAVKAQNPSLAMHYITAAIDLLEKAAYISPRQRTSMENFTEFEMARIRTIIEQRAWDEFDEAFDRMTSQVNSYHELYDRHFIKWRVPAEPPAHLDLTPRT